MSILAHLCRALAVLFVLSAVFWFLLPFLNREGGEAFIVGFLFAFISAVIAGVSFGCYRYVRRGGTSTVGRALVWCFVTPTGLLGAVLVGRIAWVSLRGLMR
jgi:hypothetical protein